MTVVALHERRGMALLVVVVLTMLIALAAYRFSFYMESQYRLTRLHEEQVHARLASLSGIELAAALLELPIDSRQALGGLDSNPALLQHVAMETTVEPSSPARSLNANAEWRCSLVSSSAASSGDVNSSLTQVAALRFGLENESAKIHLPTLLERERSQPGVVRATLLRLPGATDTLVDAWLRKMQVTKQQSNTVNSSLIDRMQNNQSEQTSDLDALQIQWYGGDLNQNYKQDPLELRIAAQLLDTLDSASSNAAMRPTANEANQIAAWQRYLTWNSGGRNETRTGAPRVNLNEPNLQVLHQQLSAIWPIDWANFVIALRQYGPATSPLANSTGSAATETESPTPDFSKPAAYTLKTVLDVVGAVVQTPSQNQTNSNQAASSGGQANVASNAKQTLRNPFSSDLTTARNYLGKLLDEASVDGQPFSVGRVDVSAASAVVLASVPGIDDSLAQRIVQLRDSSSGGANPSNGSIAWLLDNGTVDLSKLKTIEPYLTHRSDVYTVQSIGYRDSSSPVYRCTVTIDARQLPARMLHHQEWHPWDRGFTLDQLNSSPQ